VVTRFIITKTADPAEVAAQLLPKMTNLGNAIASRMQRLVPKRTFALHDTITAETVQSGGATVTTTVGFGGGTVDYGLHVERGTSRQAAQPFARPALLQSRAGDLNYSGGPPETHGAKLDRQRSARNERRRANYVGSKK
jgi:HK97 gp10 family phage protein